jgi:hypothetical protein
MGDDMKPGRGKPGRPGGGREWYRKRTDPSALYVARLCGIADVFSCVGELIHVDDIGDVRRLLDVLPETFDMLFEIDGFVSR